MVWGSFGVCHILSLFFGGGIFVYLVSIFIIPMEPKDRDIVESAQEEE